MNISAFPFGLLVFACVLLLVAVTTAIRPRWALAIVFVALPFFTHQVQNPLGLPLVALVTVFELAYAVRLRLPWSGAWNAINTQPLLLLGALFTFAAFLSLSSLPLLAILQQHAAIVDTLPVAAWHRYLAGVLWLPEYAREYSITMALLTLQGLVFALIVYREVRASAATALLLAGAITTGLVAFIALGLLESFGVVDLTWWRGQVGTLVRAGGLQSAAGNPGWFAEYVVYSLPYALVLLANSPVTRTRLTLLAGLTAMAAFALAICFQRGGWISGAIVILYMFVVTTWILATHERRNGSTWTPLARASLPLIAVVVVTAGGLHTWFTQGGSATGRLDYQAYVGRFASIRNADRLPYVGVSARMAALHPILGGGHESFSYRYRMYFEQPGGPYHRSPLRVPTGSSAHNLYLQTLSGTGVVGLALLLSMFAATGWMSARAIRAADLTSQQRIVLLAACGSLVGVACYGIVQEVFYIHSLRLLFFTAVGMIAGAAHRPRGRLRASRPALVGLLVAFVLHLGYEYAYPGPHRLLRSNEPTGLFLSERDPGGKSFQWTTDWATWPVPPGARTYALELRSLAPFPQRVDVTGCEGGEAKRIVLSDHGWYRLSGSLGNCADPAHFEVRVTPGWRPRADERLLGVMVAGVRFE